MLKRVACQALPTERVRQRLCGCCLTWCDLSSSDWNIAQANCDGKEHQSLGPQRPPTRS